MDGFDLDREFRRIAAEITEATFLTYAVQMTKLGFGGLQSIEMCK